jgi:hypothetical protein
VYQAGVIHSSEVIFDLYLEGKYPFQPPKLVCESVFAFPSVSDGRDLVNEILKQKWTPSITSADLISSIPNFFQLNLLRSQGEISVKDYGKFHLGSLYYLESWERKDSMGSFYCSEIELNSKKAVKERMIVLTHTVVLVLELNNTYPGIGYLTSWATLQALHCIRRNIKEPEVVTFEWKQIGECPSHKQVFRIKDVNSFIQLLSKNMQKLGAVVKRHSAKKLFKEDEVNGKEIKKMNIEEILQAIEVYEDNFESVMNQSVINSLLELYQRAIEYFAAFNSNQYNIFLNRMHLILSNENVMNVLQGKTSVEERKEEIVVKSQKILQINPKNEHMHQQYKEESHLEEKKEEKVENFKLNDKVGPQIVEKEENVEKIEKNELNYNLFQVESDKIRISEIDKKFQEVKSQDDNNFDEFLDINKSSNKDINPIDNPDPLEPDQNLKPNQSSEALANLSESDSSDSDPPKSFQNARVEDELI